MSKAILMSIQPKWCELIARGKKTIEVRKTAPKLETPFKCYIYETKGLCDVATFIDEDGHVSYRGRGAVIGEFVCDRIIEFTSCPVRLLGVDYNICVSDFFATCLIDKELNDYGKGKPLYGWCISDLKIYNKPKELGEFRKYGYENDLDAYSVAGGGVPIIFNSDSYKITRPPQSYCYVEDLDE